MSKNKWSDLADKAEVAETQAAKQPKDDTAETAAEDLAEEAIAGEVLEHASREGLEQQLFAMEEKANENWNLAAHHKAEFENLQRRTSRDLSNAYKFANEKIIRELLNVIDSLEHSLAIPIDEAHQGMVSMRDGIELTMQMFINSLEKFSVKQINPKVGETFDPSLHEAMSMQPDENAKPNTVLMVLQKGYALNERVIRPARVIVAAQPSAGDEKN